MGEIDIPGIATGIGPWALAVTIILALIRGDLVPRRTHDGIVAKRDETIADVAKDRDYYREQTLALLRVADVAADRTMQALLTRSMADRERGQP